MPRQTWRNWSGGVTAAPRRVVTPANEAALVAAVRAAARDGLRVAGAGHSFTPLCATEGTLVSLDALQGIESIDPATRVVMVRSGTRIAQLGAPLHQAGLTLENQGDIDCQSIAGAIGTGTHGTGRRFGSLSTQVVSLRILLASGDILTCSATENADIFRAGRVSLGLLGVVLDVGLQTVPSFRLRETNAVADVDECVSRFPALDAAHRHVEFYWLPAQDRCVIKVLSETDDAPYGAPPSVLPPPGTIERYLLPERVDWSWRIYPSVRAVPFNEMEFAMPAERGVECFLELRSLMRNAHRDVDWAIEYRTLRGDTIALSPAFRRDTVTISVHQAADRPYRAFFNDAETVFRNHHGRPHWGKIHGYGPADLAAQYPLWDEFRAVRATLDPHGVFLNDYLRALFDA